MPWLGIGAMGVCFALAVSVFWRPPRRGDPALRAQLALFSFAASIAGVLRLRHARGRAHRRPAR